MSHKKAFEALAKTLQDICGNTLAMGGIPVIISGDFRQNLPIVPRGTPADEINACIKASYLWRNVQKLTLRTNMRVLLNNDPSAAEFADLLLKIGDGEIPHGHDGKMVIPFGLGIIVLSLDDLADKVYHNLNQNYKDREWLCERAILAPRNDAVNIINERLLQEIPTSEQIYKSIDQPIDDEQAVHYPIEFLNSLDPSGMPPHKLKLKVGCPIMLLRNLDAPRLCNGTRLYVTKLHPHVIEATILTGNYKKELALIPRIPLIPSDYSIEFKRLQFPVKVCFGMTINKAQGQSLKVVGLNLASSCFSHGQLYVGCSRVGTPDSLYILAPEGKTTNIVYPHALQ